MSDRIESSTVRKLLAERGKSYRLERESLALFSDDLRLETRPKTVTFDGEEVPVARMPRTWTATQVDCIAIAIAMRRRRAVPKSVLAAIVADVDIEATYDEAGEHLDYADRLLAAAMINAGRDAGERLETKRAFLLEQLAAVDAEINDLSGRDVA